MYSELAIYSEFKMNKINKNQFPMVPYGMTVHENSEIEAVVDVLKTSTQMGPKTKEFENEIAELFGHKHGVGTNSGSSALHIAMECFNLPKGSEVITPALTFGTTIGCIVKNGHIPAFVDSESATKFVIDVNKIEEMITDKTKAMCIPNLIGNMPDWEEIKKIANKYNLLILDDSADILGGKYNGNPTGTYSDISITSFYGSHLINCAGNGGMLTTNNENYLKEARLLRSWGRRASAFKESENIENRFNVYLENVQYDAKFIFERIGYMLEPSEMGSAFGLVQLKKLKKFREKRVAFAKRYLNFLKKYTEWFELPEMSEKVDSCWLAFPIIVKESAPFSRTDLQIFLENRNIQTRVIFTGNALRQPAFKKIEKKISKSNYIIADKVMIGGLLIACHQGLTEEMINHIFESFDEFSKTINR